MNTVRFLLLLSLLTPAACDKQPPASAPARSVQSTVGASPGWTSVVDWYGSLRDDERAALSSNQAFSVALNRVRAWDVNPKELPSATWDLPVRYDQPGSANLPHLASARGIGRLCFLKALSELEAGHRDAATTWLRAGTRILTELGALPTVVERKAALDMCFDVTTFVSANASSAQKREFAQAFATINRKNPFELQTAVVFMRDWYVRDIREHPESLKDTHGIDTADLKRNPMQAAKIVDEALSAIANAWANPNAPQLIDDISRRYSSTPARPFVIGFSRVSRRCKEAAYALDTLSQSMPPN
ncbi:MAG: hypothetical protein JNL50_06200 [Phycisphaerae bacterium]|nr:hypothetical protein [Phycisphaerae bacterium]